MIYVKSVTVTSHEARELEHMGFILKLRRLHLDGLDTYDVFVRA